MSDNKYKKAGMVWRLSEIPDERGLLTLSEDPISKVCVAGEAATLRLLRMSVLNRLQVLESSEELSAAFVSYPTVGDQPVGGAGATRLAASKVDINESGNIDQDALSIDAQLDLSAPVWAGITMLADGDNDELGKILTTVKDELGPEDEIASVVTGALGAAFGTAGTAAIAAVVSYVIAQGIKRIIHVAFGKHLLLSNRLKITHDTGQNTPAQVTLLAADLPIGSENITVDEAWAPEHFGVSPDDYRLHRVKTQSLNPESVPGMTFETAPYAVFSLTVE